MKTEMRIKDALEIGTEDKYQEWYLKTLRKMKKMGLTVADMPDDVAKSALILHQRFLTILEYPRKRDLTD